MKTRPIAIFVPSPLDQAGYELLTAVKAHGFSNVHVVVLSTEAESRRETVPEAAQEPRRGAGHEADSDSGQEYDSVSESESESESEVGSEFQRGSLTLPVAPTEDSEGKSRGAFGVPKRPKKVKPGRGVWMGSSPRPKQKRPRFGVWGEGSSRPQESSTTSPERRPFMPSTAAVSRPAPTPEPRTRPAPALAARPPEYPYDAVELATHLSFSCLSSSAGKNNEIERFLRNAGATDIAFQTTTLDVPRQILELFAQGCLRTESGMLHLTFDSGPWLGAAVTRAEDTSSRVLFHHCTLSDDETEQTVEWKLRRAESGALHRCLNLLRTLPRVKRTHNSDETSFHSFRSFGSSVPLESQIPTFIANQEMHRSVFAAVTSGNLPNLSGYLDSDAIHLENNAGRTPLMEAAYHQQAACVEALLTAGANLHATNDKGTSVLMYAKTQLVHQPDRSFALLQFLHEVGADRSHLDLYGLDIYDYILKQGDTELAEELRSF